MKVHHEILWEDSGLVGFRCAKTKHEDSIDSTAQEPTVCKCGAKLDARWNVEIIPWRRSLI